MTVIETKTIRLEGTWSRRNTSPSDITSVRKDLASIADLPLSEDPYLLYAVNIHAYRGTSALRTGTFAVHIGIPLAPGFGRGARLQQREMKARAERRLKELLRDRFCRQPQLVVDRALVWNGYRWKEIYRAAD